MEASHSESAQAQDTPQLSAALAGMTVSWWAGVHPYVAAVRSPKGDRTYRELNARCNALARALRSRGFAAGEGLAMVVSNRPEFVEVLCAGLRIGARITPINFHLGPDEVAYILSDSAASALVVEDTFGPAAVAAAATAPGISVRLSLGGAVDGFESYEEALKPEEEADIEDPVLGATMLYTSGTTGRPKGVYRRDAAGYVRARAAASKRAGYRPGEDTNLLTGPAYHAGPLALSVASALNQGVTLSMMEKFDPAETLRLVEMHGVTHSHMVATMFHRLLGLPEEVKSIYDLSSLRYIIHGAAPTPVHVKKAIIDWWGPVLYEYYAATEGGGTYITPREWLERPGSVGRPVDGQVIEVRDDRGNALSWGEIGTIFIKAPERTRFEYWQDKEKTASVYSGEFFTLGDMGYVDQDGYLFVTGRSAELIISGGVNIYPAEVDAVLLAHPAVADAVTIGVPNDEWGEEVKSLVRLKSGKEPTKELEGELIEFTRERLARFKCPRSIDFVDELPREDTGKIYRRLIRDAYWPAEERA